ncbi:sulfatase [uncultured Cyclobacterium sp.]|uniref:sulfatase family protein n=1 Tax=uncultured Cyclobacterium sp. TaxID=453820 RepID=UPI0030EC95B1
MNYCKIPILLSLILFGAYTASANNRPPNFVFIITDDISAEDLSIYGNQSIDTPNLEKLAMRGLVFDNAYLTTSSCSPSRISMITGRYPHNTGGPEIHVPLPSGQNTFVQELKQSGYNTVLSGKNHMAAPDQLGFVTHSDGLPAGSEKWLPHLKNRPKDQPFFFWFASHDAHRDWQVNDKARTYLPSQVEVQPYMYDGPLTREDLTGYYHEISRLDHYVGLVLNELEAQGIMENTYVIFVSDNGRPFPRSKTYLYKNGIQTPLLIAGPKVKQGRTNALVSAIDLSATILELAGLEAPESVQGISFTEVFNDHTAIVRDVAFAERNWHRYSMHERMVRMGDWIYIRNNWPNKRNLSGESDPHAFPAAKELWNMHEKGQLTAAQYLITLLPQPAEELYHTKDDPHNLKNVIYVPENRALVHQMRVLLTRWTNQTGDNIPNKPTPNKATLDGTLLNWKRGEMPGEATSAYLINQSGPILVKEFP